MISRFTSVALWVIIRCVCCLPSQDQGGGPGPSGAGSGGALPPITSNMYPNPKRDETISDTYAKNTIVKDPYRWMEKPVPEEFKKYNAEQNAITRPYLDKNPFRAEIEARFKDLLNHPKYDGPYQAGKKYYSFQNTGLQNQDVMFVQDSLTAEPKIFLDPNALDKDGKIALNFDSSAFSLDGQIFAYSLSQNGSDRMKVKFKDIDRGDIYKEELTEVRDTVLTWTHDNKGIFYGRFLGDNPDHESVQNQKLYYHVVGTEQSKDVLVVEFPKNPDYFISTTYLSDCGKYLIVAPDDNNDHNLIYVADLEKIKFEIKGKLDLQPIVTIMDVKYEFVANDDKIFIFKTNKDANNGKLITIDITNPDPKSWKDLVPENKKDILNSALAAHDNFLVLKYLRDVKAILQLHDLKSGKLIKEFLMDIGDIQSLSGSRINNEVFFKLEKFFSPGIIYCLDLLKTTCDLKIHHEITLKNCDRNKFEVKQVFCKSKDGAQIPIFIMYKKGFEKNGNSPTILRGFGAFGENMLPSYNTNCIVLIDNLDGVFAIANVRGGGEYGEEWHRSAQGINKQKTFDDFQAASEFLISEKYTSNKMLTINGNASGGLMVAVCLNQRPDLYGAVIADQGLYDMLRYNKFTEDGKTWVSEFGSPDNDKEFEYVFKYSPLHNIKIPEEPCKQYPPTLIIDADDDNRIPHATKFIATLQFIAKSRPNQKNPLLLKVGTNTGNGASKSTEKIIADNVDKTCFIVNVLRIKFHQ